MSSDLRRVSPDAAGLLWDTCVTDKELLQRLDSRCVTSQTTPQLRSICCGWSHTLSVWLLSEVLRWKATSTHLHTFCSVLITIIECVQNRPRACVQGLQKAAMVINGLQCGADTSNLQPLGSVAELQPGQWVPGVALPHSDLVPCLSAGMQSFLMCQDQSITTLFTASDENDTAGKPTTVHEAPESSTTIASQSFDVPSKIVSAAAGSFHFAASCSNGAQPAWRSLLLQCGHLPE